MELYWIKLIQSLNCIFLDVFCELISYFSNYAGFIFIFFIFFIFFDKKYSLSFGITYGLGIGFNFLLKFLFSRPRPYEVDPTIINKLTAGGAAFPSGHSVSATIIVCFILYSIFVLYKNKIKRTVAVILSVIFIILVAFSRMYLGQHYLTDIISGISFGLIYSYLGILCYNKICKKG